MRPPLPTVTVVVVTRDRPSLLADALTGVARQSSPPLEVRIGNDGGADLGDSLAALGAIEATVIATGEGQAGASRNRAARGARGEVLAFLDDDDRWRPGHLGPLVESLADPAVDFAYRDAAIVREAVARDGERRDLGRRVIARDWDPDLARRDDYLPPSGWGVRRSLFERLGGFDSSFRYSEDWDFLLRACAFTSPRRVPGVTVEVRLRERGNASADTGGERLDCLRRLAARHALERIEPKTFWEVAETVGIVERRA
jgi:glycosyltransferase involved in cell wall biosynthesis